MSDRPPNENTVAEQSVPGDTVLWRYIPFCRFLDILKTNALWFSRPFKFDDRWEGLFPPSYLKATRKWAEANNEPLNEFDREFEKRRLRHRCAHFVSCWHMSGDESDAMWRLYALDRRGIAIQSTVSDMTECLGPDGSGAVIYYDPADKIISPTIFGPRDILFKRSPFSWEREYRFWFYDGELLETIEARKEFREELLSCGQLFPIDDMKRLIRKIVISPGAPDEFMEQLRDVCIASQKRWLADRVERSYSDRSWDSFTR